MNRQAQDQYQRFLTAFTQRNASLPAGGLLVMLDLLARAQFMEGLSGTKFNTVSARASSSKGNLIKAIGLLMQKIDPTLSPLAKDLGDMTSTTWTGDGSSGLYKSAWLGANRVFAKTQSEASGVPLEATDLLNQNMLQKMDLEGSDTDIAVSINEQAIVEANKESGNFFWAAGMKFRPKKMAVVHGELGVEYVGGAVALYAKNAAIKVLAKRNTEMKAQLAALEAGAMPSGGEEDDVGAAMSEMGLMGFNGLLEAALNEPNHPFYQDFMDWLPNNVLSTLTANEQAVMRPYIDLALAGNLPPSNDAYAKSVGMTPQYFGQVRNKFLAAAFKQFTLFPPDFLNDAQNQMFLRNMALGRIRAASVRRVAAEAYRRLNAGCEKLPEGGMRDNCEKKKEEGEDKKEDKKAGQDDAALRVSIIRLAHSNPALRSHLLPLLKTV